MSNSDHTIVRDKTFEVIRSAVNQMVDLIRPTLGPASNKVIIDKFLYRKTLDDGVQIARDFELNDPAENAVIKLIRETAVTTNDRAGDGTTTALIMLQAIINEVGRKSKFDGRKIELELKSGLDDVRKQLKNSAREIKTKEDILKVARIAFDDEPIAEMIAGLYHELGKEAVITIDKSPTMKTTVEKADGIKLESGYISPYMVTNPQRMETEIEKPYILITDYRLTEAKDVVPIMEKMASEGKSNLIIIAENVEQHALATMVINSPMVINPETRKPGTFMSVAIAIPKVAERKTFLEDLALLTGAEMFTESKGVRLENLTTKDLGQAAKIIIRRENTVIVNPKGNRGDVATAITSLRYGIEREENKNKADDMKRRLANLTNMLAVVKVGALTQKEQEALKYKVEDALNAVRSAYRKGVVCGAGLALARIKTSSPILNEALKYPARQLMENMGLEESVAFALDKDHVMNVVTGKVGPYMTVGVVDPVDVLLAGVESAVSIASLLLTSSGMIVEHPKTPEK